MRAALVLAAGGSRRFGRADKLLAPLHGRPLLLHAVEQARQSGARRIYVVVSAPRVRRLIGHRRGVIVVQARDPTQGLSASLATGLRALRPIEREVLVFLGDMPFARAPRRMRVPAGSIAARPVYRGMPGHPLLIRTLAAKHATLRGDTGLGGLSEVERVRGTPGNLIDIDSRAALRRARSGSLGRPTR